MMYVHWNSSIVDFFVKAKASTIEGFSTNDGFFAFRMEGQGELSFLLLLLLLGTFYSLPVFMSLHQQMDILSYGCYVDIKTLKFFL